MSEISHDLPELRARFAVQDFLVDFLGGLVPGLLFLLGLVFSILPVILLAFAALLGAPRITFGSFIARGLEATKLTPNTIWIAGFLVLITIAYVVGHLFYRRGPKVPDQESFRRITKRYLRERRRAKRKKQSRAPWWHLRATAEKFGTWRHERSDILHEEERDELKRDFGCSSFDDCEFPYPYLDLYLERRGHHHLLPFIRWKGGSEMRSKTYVNLLKIRLRYHHPEKCSEVIKNEAHVRLSSSTWHVARALRFCSLGAIIALLLPFFVVIFLGSPYYDPWGRAIMAALTMPLSVLFLAWFGRSRIENILHYQRMREVFFVLETAYIAFREHPELLEPPFSEFVEAIRGEGAE
jgi:hypothetical protein